MDKNISPVEQEKAYRLLNHGPVVLVSARHDGIDDVMAASWACMLDIEHPKLTLVLDKIDRTRELVEKSGIFAIQVPTAAQLELTYKAGNYSLYDMPDKLRRVGAEFFEIEEYGLPFVAGCSGWMACKVIPEPHNQKKYDLYIAEVLAAWSDTRVFSNGHWHFENAGPEFRSLHYVAGGHFYAIGEALDVDESIVVHKSAGKHD